MTPELRGSTIPAEGRERSGRKKNGEMDTTILIFIIL